ncbi:hypothetical protein [Clostridium porci]|nr:hypothetical protein [Clostridium porci]
MDRSKDGNRQCNLEQFLETYPKIHSADAVSIVATTASIKPYHPPP